MACRCAKCRHREFEALEFDQAPQGEFEFEFEDRAAAAAGRGAFSEADELELAMELMSVSSEEEQELEKARRVVRVAGTAAQRAARSSASADPQSAVRSTIVDAARLHLPQFVEPDRENRWVRRGDRIVILGARAGLE